jgi:hypothetical protein
MPSDLPTVTPTTGLAKFFSKPESKAALVPAVAVGIALFWFWGEISDFVVHAVDNLLHLILVAVAIFGVLFVLFDKDVRNAVWYMYRGALRAALGIFVRNDPLSIRKSYLEKMIAKRAEFQTALNDSSGQQERLNNQVDKDNKEYREACSLFAAATKQNNKRTSDIQARQMARLHAMLDQDTEDMKKVFLIVTLLSRYRDICDDSIVDTKNEIKFQERNQERSKSFLKSMRAAWSILHGIPEDEEIQEMATSELEKQYAARMGEVNQILDMSKGIVSTADVKDAATIEQAEKLFADWKSQQQLPAPAQAVQLPAPAEKQPVASQAAQDEYADWLRRQK